MRGFEEVGIPSSYISQIERDGLLPGPDKLDALAKVFETVAKEQRARDAHEDGWILKKERDLTRFERLAQRTLKDLNEEDRTELAKPLQETLRELAALDIDQRAEFADEVLPRLVAAVPNAVATAIGRNRIASRGSPKRRR